MRPNVWTTHQLAIDLKLIALSNVRPITSEIILRAGIQDIPYSGEYDGNIVFAEENGDPIMPLTK